MSLAVGTVKNVDGRRSAGLGQIRLIRGGVGIRPAVGRRTGPPSTPGPFPADDRRFMPPGSALVVAVRSRHGSPGVVGANSRRGNGEVGRYVRDSPDALAHNPALYSARCMVYTIQRSLYRECVTTDRWASAEIADEVAHPLGLLVRPRSGSLAVCGHAPITRLVVRSRPHGDRLALSVMPASACRSRGDDQLDRANETMDARRNRTRQEGRD